MGVTKLTTNGIIASAKYDSFKANNQPVMGGAFESIATVIPTVGATSVTFSSIPSTFAHLHLRLFARDSSQTYNGNLAVRFNSDTASNYSYHYMYSVGSSNGTGSSSTTIMLTPMVSGTGNGTSVFAAGYMDVLNYANTNIYKTIKSFGGFDSGTYGELFIDSGSWRSTSAVNTITITSATFPAYCHFALYGVS